MGLLSVSLRNGIVVQHAGSKLVLDPTRPNRADYIFFSHAHLDHISVPANGSRVISSTETKLLASARGYDLGTTCEKTEGVSLLDSGHMLGARALYIEDEFLYTGDAAGRARAFLAKCKTKRAKVLVTETTYGSPEYVFPPTEELLKRANAVIGEIFDKGRPVVLMGYPVGKAQVLAYLFSVWSPMLFHSSLVEFNEIHRRCGVRLKQGRVVDSSLNGVPPGPSIIVAPMMSPKSGFVSALKKRYGAVTVAFSGWATRKGYRPMIGADHAFPLSDHCDYQELLQMVHDVSPEVVYTTHGFAEEFANDLRQQGYDAKPLNAYQSNLSDF